MPRLPPSRTIGLLLLLLAGAAPADQLYRWVDDAGVARYSDRVPPDDAGREQLILDERGIAVEQRKAQVVLTPAEQAAQRRARAQAEAQATQDALLLRTYASEAEILAARDARLDDLRHLVEVAEQQQRNLRQVVEQHQAEARRLAAQDQPSPAHLVQALTQASQELDQRQQYIRHRRQEMAAARVQFDAQAARLRALQAATP